MHRLSILYCTLGSLVFSHCFSLVSVQSAEKPTTAFECRWTDAPPKIDGVADDAAWKKAQQIDHFYLPWLKDSARPSKTATRVKLLWDRENFYFFAEMDDADLYADVREHDGQAWDNDVFELFFKPADDKPGYYEFQVNAAGTVLDMFLPQRGAGGYKRFKSEGTFHVAAKVKLKGSLNKWQDKDEGWSVEGKIPWVDFLRTGGPPQPDEKWKFALCRYDYSVGIDGPELSTCAPLTAANFHRHEDYAPLQFVGPRSEHAVQPFGMKEWVPLTTSHVVGSPEPPPPFQVERTYEKLPTSWPMYMSLEPGSPRLIFIEQTRNSGPCRLMRTRRDPATCTSADDVETLLEIDGLAYSLTFHPKFAENGFMYVGHKSPLSSKDNRKCCISRFTIGRQPPFALDKASEVRIIEWESDGHDGVALGFGNDGMLYITSGDGTSDSDTNVTGQGLDHLLAKLLRIDVDHAPAGQTYAVPADNPFVGQPNIRPETWAYGFRNPWRLSVDPETGAVWVGNNGQDLWEQIYRVERGANYGWSVYEGGHIFYPTRKLGPTPHVKPTVEHPHSEARSLTGGVTYYGKKYPDLRGAYIYGDYSTGKIWGVKHDGKQVTWHKELADTTLQIAAFAFDADGELLICDHQAAGGFYRFVSSPEKVRSTPFPRRLSESGLFRTVAGHQVEPSLIPYSVNAPLWSDGSHKARFIAVPAKKDDSGKWVPDPIEMTERGPWTFPNGTVLVKSFALDMQAGQPDSRKWVETRFLLREQNEWVGYSYQWNEEQTDAFLVEKEGRDQVFTIQTAEGMKPQTWHYPSRAECMVCHSRAAKYVLGLSTMQLNKTHDYNGVEDQQLRVFEQLGVLKTDWKKYALEHIRKAWEAEGLKTPDISRHLSQASATAGQRESQVRSLLGKPPEDFPKMANPYDETANLEERVRAYLHSNCAQCHVESGGGNAQMELASHTPIDKMRILDAVPVHHTFDLPDARLVAPGHPERSVLLHRMSLRGRGQMPQLSTYIVDDPAVALIRKWISQLPATPPTSK